MSGQELKKVLTENGYLLKDVATKLGLTQPNFSQVMKAQDVKTGTLESICDVLGVKMDFFYEGTRFAPEYTVALKKEKETDTQKDVAYLQGQLNAMKEAYKALLESIASGSANSLRVTANV